jgi:hypothetical protein
MAARDRGRFADARKRLNESPLGAAALAGTSFPIDRAATAKALGFDRPMANSLDAVSDRDFVLETLSAASIAAVHMSRFAEEIVIWTSPLVGLVRLSDKFTTGSSIMPQKRNPDAAELVRAKTGRVIGALTALLIVMKGLPLAYQKDMQEDKQGAMEAFGALSLAIRAMTGMVEDLVPDEARMKAAAGEGYATATDLADWLVRTLKMPFRDAHHVTGRIVSLASKQGVALHELPLKAMQEVEPKITATPCGRCRWKPPSRAGPAMAAPRRRTCFRRPKPGQAAGKRAKISLRKKFRCNFLGFRGSSALARARQSLYGAARIGDFVVISNYRPSSSGWAIILLSVTALALGAAAAGAGSTCRRTRRRCQARQTPRPSARRSPASSIHLRVRSGARGCQGQQEKIRSRSAAGLSARHEPLRLSRRRAARRGRQPVRTRGRCRHAVLLLFDGDAGAPLPRLHRGLCREKTVVCYAMKANSNQSVLRTLAKLGAGADVVSGGELKRALAAGIPPGKILFSGVGKTEAELRAALAADILCINVESEPELELLSKLAVEAGKTARISVRVNPDVDAGTHAKIATGKSENKFGVPIARAREVYARAAKLPGSR